MSTGLVIDQEPATGATYCSFSSAPVAATRHVGDLVFVDVDARGRVVGIELAGGLDAVTEGEWQALAQVAPHETVALRARG